MGQKISELTDGVTAQGSDLVRVARVNGGGFIDRKLSLAEVSALASNVTQNITITGGNNLRFADFGDGTNTVGTGATRSLSSLGYTEGTAATQFPNTAISWGTIDVTTVDYDTACIQEAFLTLANGTNKIRKLVAGDGAFVLAGHEIYLPSYKSGIASNVDSQMFIFDGEGTRFRVTGTQTNVFTMNITDQVEARDSCVDNRWRFGNFKMVGNGNAVGIRFGATRSPLIEQIELNNFVLGWQSGFMLNAMYMNIATDGCTTGMKIDKGWWTNAGYGTAGNQPRFLNCRWRMTDATHVGCHILGTDTPLYDGCTVEGTDASYGILCDIAGSTVSKKLTIRNLHAEMGTGGTYANAIIGLTGRDAHNILIEQVYNQCEVADQVLLEMNNTQGVNKAVLFCNDNSENNDAWIFRNLNNGGAGSWDFINTRLKGNPTTDAQVYDVANTLGIWTADSDIPVDRRGRLTKLLI